jgi:hypothetical protein
VLHPVKVFFESLWFSSGGAPQEAWRRLKSRNSRPMASGCFLRVSCVSSGIFAREASRAMRRWASGARVHHQLFCKGALSLVASRLPPLARRSSVAHAASATRRHRRTLLLCLCPPPPFPHTHAHVTSSIQHTPTSSKSLARARRAGDSRKTLESGTPLSLKRRHATAATHGP